MVGNPNINIILKMKNLNFCEMEDVSGGKISFGCAMALVGLGLGVAGVVAAGFVSGGAIVAAAGWAVGGYIVDIIAIPIACM